MLTYTTACVTKHFNNFNVLLVGRLFCGVATSLLNSVFESWLVAEHRKVGTSCSSPSLCLEHGCLSLGAGANLCVPACALRRPLLLASNF